MLLREGAGEQRVRDDESNLLHLENRKRRKYIKEKVVVLWGNCAKPVQGRKHLILCRDRERVLIPTWIHPCPHLCHLSQGRGP